MEKTTGSWMKKSVVALLALLVAGCCMLLAGCAEENSEEAVRKVVTEELDQVKNIDEAAIEELAGDSSEFQELETYGITATDAYNAVFSDFDYQIESVEVDGDTATVGVKFTTKDFTKFQSALTEAAQKASTDGSLTGLSTQQLNEKIGQLVMDVIKDLPTTETDVVELECTKTNGKWELDDSAGDAFAAEVFPVM